MVKKLLKAIFLLGCLGWIASQVQVDALWGAIRKMHPVYVALAFFFHGLTLLVDTLRHRLILQGELSFADAFRAKLWGVFSGNLVPTSLGSDATRGWWLVQKVSTLSKSRILASLLLSRLQGLMVLTPMVALGLLLDSALPRSRWLWAIPFGFAGVLASGLVFYIGTHPAFARRVSSLVLRLEAKWTDQRRLSNAFSKLFEAFRYFRSGRLAWLEGLSLSCLLLGSNSALLWSLCRAAEAAGPFSRLLWVSPSVGLATLLPLGVNSFGTQDVSWMKLMAQIPADLPIYLGISLTWHFIRLLWSLPGMAFFPGRGNPRGTLVVDDSLISK